MILRKTGLMIEWSDDAVQCVLSERVDDTNPCKSHQLQALIQPLLSANPSSPSHPP